MRDKAELRAALLSRRDAEPHRPAKSRAIAEHLVALPECRNAKVVASYVGVGSEVATTELLERFLRHGKVVAVPWRSGNQLEFAVIESLAELAPASFGLLEPLEAVRRDPARRQAPQHIDLLLIPGLGFDRTGARLGHGRGYYDRFLRRSQATAPRIALAYQCQLVDRIPMGPADEPVDVIVTERAVYRVNESEASAGR